MEFFRLLFVSFIPSKSLHFDGVTSVEKPKLLSCCWKWKSKINNQVFGFLIILSGVAIFIPGCNTPVTTNQTTIPGIQHSTLITTREASVVDSLIHVNRIEESLAAYQEAESNMTPDLTKAYLTYKLNKSIFYHNYFYPCDSLEFISYDSVHTAFQMLNAYYADDVFHNRDSLRHQLKKLVYDHPSDSILRVEMWSEMGRYYFNEGNNPDSSNQYFTLALNLADKIGYYSFTHSYSWWNLAFLQFTLRFNDKALIYSQSILSLIPQEAVYDHAWLVLQESLEAYCLYRLGRHDEGKRKFENAHILSKNLKCTFARQEWYKLYFSAQLNRSDKNIEEFHVAALDSIVHSDGDFCNYHKITGEYLIRKYDDYENAESHMEKAFQYINQSRPLNVLQLYTVMFYLRVCYYINGNHQAALDVVYSQDFFHIPKEIVTFNPHRLWDEEFLNKHFYYVSLYSYTEILFDQYKINGNIENLWLAHRLIHTADSLVSREIKSFNEEVLHSVYNTSTHVYENGALVSFELYQKTNDPSYLSDYLYFIEKNRSRLLYRDIQLSKAEDPRFHSYFEQEKLIRQKIEFHYSKRQYQELLMAYHELESLFEHFQQTTSLNVPDYEKSNNQGLHFVKDKLESGQVFIDISAMRDEVFVLYLGNDIDGIINIPLDEHLRKHLSTVSDAMLIDLGIPPDTYAESAYYLFSKLFAPIPGVYDKILYSAGYPFSMLNPESLIDRPVDMTVATYELPYLVHKCRIKSIESIYLYEKYNALQSPTVTGFFHSDAKTLVSLKDTLLKEQPGNIFEMNLLSHLFEESRMFSGKNCTKKYFLESLNSESEILHTSVHGSGSAHDRREIYLLFRNKPNQPDTLYGYELLTAENLPALVVLAACESGRGKHQSGEGHYTLARYFLQGGSRHVVRSLWNLDDTSGSLLMQSFYRHLINTSSVSGSLQEAKRELLMRYPNFNHPYFWAGVI